MWQSPLHVAAANDAVACAEMLIPQLSNLNFSDRAGRQALHHAAFNGHLNVVNLLIKHGANIHAYDRQERRAIHWAAYMGHTEIIKVLVSHGAEIHCKDKRCGDTPMHAAAAAGQTTAVKMLLDLGFDINTQNNQKCTPLHLACFNGQDVVVHELLQAGADPNISNDQGCNSLHHAAASTHGALCLELLVNSGANVNVQNKDGKTPLHMTAVHGRFTRSQALLQGGARADILDFHGNSSLHVAAKHGHELLVSTLLEAGADPSKHGSKGRLAIHLAALKGHVNSCRKLISAHASEESGLTPSDVIAISDEDGRNCLHHDACGGSLECLDVFLSYVSNTNVLMQPDKCGRIPLHYALSAARRECARRLVGSMTRSEDLEQNLNLADNDGRTLLHHAAASDANGGCVELLVERGVDVLTCDSAGFTPLHFAAASGHETVVRMIVEADTSILKSTHSTDVTVPSPLHLASYHGHVGVVLYLAELLLNLDIPDSDGRTPLELAAFQGNAECMRALQMQGACVTQRNTISKRTALHAAASNGHISCMQLLIEGAMLDQSVDNNGIGKFVNGRDIDKCTPLMHCVTNGHLTGVDFLMARSALMWPVDRFGCNAIHRAAAVGREDILRNLIHHTQQQQRPGRARFSNMTDSTASSSGTFAGNVGDPISARTHDGRTALHFAAIRGNLSMLENLLQITNTVNAIDRYGYTPLHYACFEGQEPCVDAILLHDSFLKFEGSPSTPLHCAVYNDNEACAERLLETLGNDVINLKDKGGRTPLHTCIMNDYTDSAHFLLSHSADVDATDNQGHSPLMLAASLGHDNSVEMLITFKADCALVDEGNNNALHLACENENEQCALLLIDNIDVTVINAQNNAGRTPLHIAARKGLVSVTMKLLEKGSSVDATDNDGLNPALACAPNNNVADCLDMIVIVMMKYVSSSVDGNRNSLDMSSVRASLESCRRSQGSLPSYKINCKPSDQTSAEPEVVKENENTQEDSDSETY
uniref:Zinc finger protein LOC723799 n=1 Tax=Phallusia mammillata TaxID=59560 RepID=A0A6F9D728_9ASCI|nr:zinc finger protein LOC723799 [Phallusia mammillata]